MSHTTPPSPMPVGGDPSKPGAWTDAQIAEWNRVADCATRGHIADARDETCARCGAIVRTLSPQEPDYASINEHRGFDEDSATRAAEDRYERMLGL